MYCIYTDADVSNDEGNSDHVIPLSLSGLDQFCVWSDKDFNSEVGSKVDGAIANDPLVMFARREVDARGHSGVAPVPKWKKSEFEGRPAQVSFDTNEIKLWDAKSKTYLAEKEIAGKLIKSEFRMDRYSAVRFVAKVALEGAYFVYGDAIRSTMNCDELRRIITLDVESAKADPAFMNSKVIVCDRFHPDIQKNHDAAMYKAMCEFTGRSTVICVPHHDAIAFHVGVVGMYMGTVICPADTSGLPNDLELHDLGHVVVLGPGDME